MWFWLAVVTVAAVIAFARHRYIQVGRYMPPDRYND